MTRDWSEDEIAAFVDGELVDDEAERIAAILERDREAAAVADRLRAQGALLREAFGAPMMEETPAELRAALSGAGAGAGSSLPPARRRPQGSAGRGSSRGSRLGRLGGRAPVWIGGAVAASLVFMVGLGSGAALFGSSDPAEGAGLAIGPAPQAALAALETAASGATLGGVTPLASFATREGHCREFEAAASVGLACRAAAEPWRIVALSAVESAAADSGARPGFAPASGAAVDALSAVLDALEAGPALSPDEEGRRIADGWRR